MNLPSYFFDFLAQIRPTSNQREELVNGHRTLRSRLLDDKQLSACIVSTFLQGSHRRATAIRPKAGKRSDVDIVVVTKLSEDEYTPEEAMGIFIPFLEKYYKGKWEPQGRSFGITMSHVDLDLVITAAPSESEIGIYKSDSVAGEDTPEDVDDWKLSKSWVSLEHRSQWNAEYKLKEAAKEPEWKVKPLLIPDRDKAIWAVTHPLAQIAWTWAKNRACNDHYVNVVKAIKWHRRVVYPDTKYPKGYPIEHLIGACCPNGITSVAEGVTHTLEAIVANYRLEAALSIVPTLPDHGVPEHNVFHRLTGEDFAKFYTQVSEAAKIARRALDATTVKASTDAWRELFGNAFDEASASTKENGGGSVPGGYTPRTGVTTPGEGRFAHD